MAFIGGPSAVRTLLSSHIIYYLVLYLIHLFLCDSSNGVNSPNSLFMC